ncbi:MAG: WbqC family protein [Bacteroidia bacterium]
MNQSAILPSAYLAPIQYFSKLKNYENCLIEHFENFPKQTYRSRCNIYSPNGLLTLSIPLVKRNHRQRMKDIKISYDYNWQKIHWRTLESSYRSSPFFEYYEDDLISFYESEKTEYLIDFNEVLQQKIMTLLKLKNNYSFTTEYKESYSETIDFRNIIHPKIGIESDPDYIIKPYWQVFETKHGFIPNLSIVDLLFNQGSKALEFL